MTKKKEGATTKNWGKYFEAEATSGAQGGGGAAVPECRRSYRCVAVHAADAVEIDGRQALIRQAVVKAASRTVASFLVCVVQRHLKHTNILALIHTHTHTYTFADGSKFLHSSQINGALKAT